MMHFIGPRGRLILRFVFTWFLCFVLFRSAFFFVFSSYSSEWTWEQVLYALYLGLKFDMRMSLIVTLPLALFSLLPWLNPLRKIWARRLWLVYSSVVLIAVLIFYALDFGFYSYLNGRVNSTALDFLENPLISATMVWQSYPLVWILLGLFMASGAGIWVFHSLVLRPSKEPRLRSKLVQTVVSLSFVLFFLLGLHAKVSQYPLRWSEAFFSPNAFVSALALHPVLYFFDTLADRKQVYDIEAVKTYYPAVAEYLGIDASAQKPLQFARKVKATPLSSEQMNVVIIVMESLAAYKTGVLGHPLNPTPGLDQIAKEGVLFTKHFTPSEGTARSMFALITGIPDVTSHRTSSRNPLIVDQYTVLNSFRDHDKYYFLGGSANWGNIRGIFSHNIPDIQIIEEGMFEKPSVDVWGISDLHLLEEAHQRFIARDSSRPFVAVIQTAGFHRPYTIPEERGDFEELELDPKEVRKYGFVSNEEFNSLRFADYSLAQYFELAKEADYFENTLFVILGDHGLPDYNAAHVSESYKKHSLERWHVPLIFYAPKYLKPRVVEDVVTQPDILPSVAALVQPDAIITTLGKNLFAEENQVHHKAFTWVYYNPQIALFDEPYYFKALPDGKILGLYDLSSEDPGRDVRELHPEKFQEMKNLTFGLFETSKYMLYFNKKSAAEKVMETQKLSH